MGDEITSAEAAGIVVRQMNRVEDQLTAARSEANSLRERVEEAFEEGYNAGNDAGMDTTLGAQSSDTCSVAWENSDAYKALASLPGLEHEIEGLAEAAEHGDEWVTDPEEGDR